LNRYRPSIHRLADWGPLVRLACSFRRFEHFETALADTLGSATDETPALSFLGSGDFHHVSLAMLRRVPQPFNLLILDNHPDWMRGIPFLHCGTWLHHAAQLANVRTIYHVGGNVDFDNRFRLLAPWQALRSGKIHVISGIRRFERGAWSEVAFPALRFQPNREASPRRIDQLLHPLRAELARWPLYVSLDKDVLTAKDAVVNWDSGHLMLAEVENVLSAFVDAAHHQLVGMDIVGDWSPVHLYGLSRRLLHLTEHPRLKVTPHAAAQSNQATNLRLAQCVQSLTGGMAETGMSGQELLADQEQWLRIAG